MAMMEMESRNAYMKAVAATALMMNGNMGYSFLCWLKPSWRRKMKYR